MIADRTLHLCIRHTPGGGLTAECHASGSPGDPEFELIDRFPLTDNETATTERAATACADFFTDRARGDPAAVRE